jgi:hypothetical protein
MEHLGSEYCFTGLNILKEKPFLFINKLKKRSKNKFLLQGKYWMNILMMVYLQLV